MSVRDDYLHRADQRVARVPFKNPALQIRVGLGTLHHRLDGRTDVFDEILGEQDCSAYAVRCWNADQMFPSSNSVSNDD